MAASSPYNDPPVRQMASTTAMLPRYPGEPPRTSIETGRARENRKTVQPVGPSAYSPMPMDRSERPRFNSSPDHEVTGLRPPSTVSLDRGTGLALMGTE